MDESDMTPGSFDSVNKNWIVRRKDLRAKATIRQLRKLFGEEVPSNEKGSRPFWRKYLALLQSAKDAKSLAIRQEFDCETANDFPNISQTDGEILNLTGNADDLLLAQLLANLRAKPQVPKAKSLKAEMDAFKAKIKSPKEQGNFQRVFSLLLRACEGDLDFSKLDFTIYRKWNELASKEPWGAGTLARNQKRFRQFLKSIEANFNLNFGFLRNPENVLSIPDGKKEKWTLEEIKLFNERASGKVKLIFLLGLNCGFIRADVLELRENHLEGDYLSKVRAKHQWRIAANKTVVQATWKLWDRTKELLGDLPLTANDFKKFDELRLELGIKVPHSGLRKSSVQALWDKVPLIGKDCSWLFRSVPTEGKGGNPHFKSYIEAYTPEQIELLANGLQELEKVFFS